MSFYLVTPTNWNRCIRQAGSKAAATKRAAIEFPGRDLEVELVGPARLASLKAAGLRLPTDALALVNTWSAKQAEKAARVRTATASRKRAQNKALAARDGLREAKVAEKAEAQREALKARNAARRVALKAEWKAEAAAAVARGEPFADREAQRIYMQGKRSLDAHERRRAREALKQAGGAADREVRAGEVGPALIIGEGHEWNGTKAPW